MKLPRLGTVSIIAITTALTLSACVPAPVGDGAGLSGTIIGAGASSQQAAPEAWVRGFQLANLQATIEYDPIGSGGGRDTFMGGGAVFAASDRAFSVEEIAEEDFVSCVPGTGILEIAAYISDTAPRCQTPGAIEKWPLEFGGEAALQTSGIVDAVTNGTGTIGYADASRAGELGTVSVKVSDEYVLYSPEAAAAIVNVSPFGEGRGPISPRLFDRASAAGAATR
ncbi:Phosphate ABC transporter, periplasmic phosphate-binding protein PstS [Leifsonia rubra CMS 76R]|nr:Phosphate ABC transporter, periplasmic phosphate-binding protein PstS [Leifsonia rubra CMS 76R]